MNWDDLTGRPRGRAAARISYGPLPQNFGDLWLPETPGGPLVVMIHGGCWTRSVADLSLMDFAAEDLTRRGLAVWNIEYRCIDETGGGYPGTFEDVALAVDAAPDLARAHGRSWSRPVVIGHSAGGHLALWAAGRPRLPAASPLWRSQPVRFAGVIDLAGVADLRRDLDTACGPEAPVMMAGPGGPERPDPYADTSPAAMVPLGVPQVVIHGREDETVPPRVGRAYAGRAQAAGDDVRFLTPPGGHVEVIAPGAPAWETAARELERLLLP